MHDSFPSHGSSSTNASVNQALTRELGILPERPSRYTSAAVVHVFRQCWRRTRPVLQRSFAFHPHERFSKLSRDVPPIGRGPTFVSGNVKICIRAITARHSLLPISHSRSRANPFRQFGFDQSSLPAIVVRLSSIAKNLLPDGPDTTPLQPVALTAVSRVSKGRNKRGAGALSYGASCRSLTTARDRSPEISAATLPFTTRRAACLPSRASLPACSQNSLLCRSARRAISSR